VQKVFTFNAASVKKSKSSFTAILPRPVLISGVPVWLNNHDVLEKLAEVGKKLWKVISTSSHPKYLMSAFFHILCRTFLRDDKKLSKIVLRKGKAFLQGNT
jgi:hypothetical protein